MLKNFPRILKLPFPLLNSVTLDCYESLILFQSSDKIDFDRFCITYGISVEGPLEINYFTISVDIASTNGFIF